MSMRVPYLSSDLYRPLAVHCMLGVINVSAAHVLLTPPFRHRFRDGHCGDNDLDWKPYFRQCYLLVGIQ